MQLQILPQTFAVCQIQDTSQINWQMPLFFYVKLLKNCPWSALKPTFLQQFCNVNEAGGL